MRAEQGDKGAGTGVLDGRGGLQVEGDGGGLGFEQDQARLAVGDLAGKGLDRQLVHDGVEE